MATKPQKQNYRNIASRMLGKLTNKQFSKRVINRAIRIYTNKYDISLSNFIIPEGGFKTFNEFFTRKFVEGKRPIGQGLVSPVDGYIYDYGKITKDNKIYVKFKHYYVEDLLGEECKDMNSYSVLYLSPADYHRVHACFDMNITGVSYLPGTLHSVKQKVVRKKDSVYCRNERIVIYGDSEYGKFYFILVGALLVGKVKLSFDSGLQTNIRNGVYSTIKYDKSISIKKGEELGYFEMGSSVVILLEDNLLADFKYPLNTQIRMGESLA